MRIEKKTLNDSFCRKVCSVLDQVPNIVRTRLKLISFAEWLTSSTRFLPQKERPPQADFFCRMAYETRLPTPPK